MTQTLVSLEKFDVEVKYHALLSDYTTFQLGGPCKALLECQTPSQLEQVVCFLSSQGEDFILIGGGSNLVVSDRGIPCYVIRYLTKTPLIKYEREQLIVSGSTLLDDLVKWAALEGLEGINYASGIPGTVGGAVVGNAGAFGKQIGDITESVRLLTPQGEKKEVSASDMKFTYRDSILKQTNDIVLKVKLLLHKGNRDTLLKERADILQLRHQKHPDLSIDPCAGSFFRNIEPTSKAEKRQAAGWFLEQSGAKSLTQGGARIFEKHANIIVKSSGCRAQDVYQLSLEMRRLVKEKFNIDLVREVRFVGEFENRGFLKDLLIW